MTVFSFAKYSAATATPFVCWWCAISGRCFDSSADLALPFSIDRRFVSSLIWRVRLRIVNFAQLLYH